MSLIILFALPLVMAAVIFFTGKKFKLFLSKIFL